MNATTNEKPVAAAALYDQLSIKSYSMVSPKAKPEASSEVNKIDKKQVSSHKNNYVL